MEHPKHFKCTFLILKLKSTLYPTITSTGCIELQAFYFVTWWRQTRIGQNFIKKHLTSSPITSSYTLSNVNTTFLNEGPVPQQENQLSQDADVSMSTMEKFAV
jgi:hypothetical protein